MLWLVLFLFFLSIVLLPVRVKYIFEQFGHGLLERIILSVSGGDEVVNHFHNDVIVYSRLPILKLIRTMGKIVILN